MNIPAIARAALVTAWEAADSALVDATIRTGPTTEYSPDTDSTATTWAAETECRVLFYSQEEGREVPASDPKAQQRSAMVLVRRVDIEPATPGLADEVEVASVAWKIIKVETPPADAIQIFTLSR